MKQTTPTATLVMVIGSILAATLLGVGMVLSFDTTFITTQVNITQSQPTISAVVINSGTSINLTEGGLRNVVCNVTIVNYNGLEDTEKVNGTFFRNNGTDADGYGVYGSQDNNSRYHNANCSYNATIAAFTYSYLCDFNVTYYAFNGTWNCTAWANNTLNRPTNGTAQISIYPLFAINVTATMDFGNLSVLDTSGMNTANITNFGNMPINMTVYGYGNTTNASGHDNAFNCPSGSNISISNLRYTIQGNAVAWDSMTALTSGPKLINDVSISKQSTDQMQWNTTYWKLYVPPNPFGLCNGTIVFEAIQGGN
jgi:hypothetical protein